jgi:SAM-dependent methyltransferase
MSTFDAAKFKATTRNQWDSAAGAWHRWGPTLSAWLGPATEVMFDLAGVATGSRVLDVAAGAGEQTLAAARRVGSNGSVVATDISAAILEHCARDASIAGLTNVETLAVDGEDLSTFPNASFDAVISRVGLIYFPDRHRALRGMLRVLRSGGRVGAIVYSTPENNGFFSLPVSIIRRHAGLAPPEPGMPGPFSLGSPGVLEKALSAAGFSEIVIRKVDAPLLLPTAADCLRFEQESFGALHQMLSGLDAAGKKAAWDEIAEVLGNFQTAAGFEGPCELLVAAGTKPV